VWPWDDQKSTIIKIIKLLQCVADGYIKFEGIVEKKKELIQALKNLVNDYRDDDSLDLLLFSHRYDDSVEKYEESLANIFHLISEYDGCWRKFILSKDTEIMLLTDEFKKCKDVIIKKCKATNQADAGVSGIDNEDSEVDTADKK